MEAERDRPAFGALVRDYRIAAGLTQEALAERARMSTNGIGSLERGDRRAPQRETVALLAEALGLTAAERTRFEAAAGRTARPSSRDQRGPAAKGRAMHNLPPELSRFVGRGTEVAEIAELVRERRLVTLTGTGGLGKTRTALQVGTAISDDTGEGVWLAELASVRDPSLVAATIARALEVHETPHGPVLETLLAFLRNKSLLLIVDNCEHVIDGVRSVAVAIARSCPGVRILATSREPLRVAGEHAYQLPPLGVPPPGPAPTAATARSYDAVALFAERAIAVDARFTLTNQNAPIVAEICRRLDGIPLAIELAAARVKVLAPRQLAQKLDERFALLTGGDPSALPRQQTMRALIDWSYDLLSVEERRLLRCLSVFAGGFTLETASAVAGLESDVLDLLSSLVDKSLVHADLTGNEARYRLLESTREYAREKLIECGEYDSVSLAHTTAYLDLAERLELSWDATPDSIWLPRAEPELENWRTALEWTLVARRDVIMGARLAGALRLAWRTKQTVEGRRWVRIARETLDETAPAAEKLELGAVAAVSKLELGTEAAVAKLELAAAELDAVLGQRKPSYAAAEQAVARYRELDDPVGTVCAERIAGLGLVYLGRNEEGQELLVGALEKARELGLRKRTGHVLQSLAVSSYLAGDVAEARDRFLAALAIFKEAGADRLAADTAQNLAEAEFYSGDAESALRLSEDALTRGRTQGFTRSVVLILCNRSAYLIALRRFDEARTEAREALELAREAQLGTLIALTLQHLAAVAVLDARGDADDRRRERARGARLLGYVDEALRALGAVREFTEVQEAAKVVAALRASFGADEIARLLAEGRTWTPDRAFEQAMSIGALSS